MKKIMVICLALVIIACMSVTTFATNGGFFESPSVNPAPEIDSFENESAECTADLVITPYAERETLDDDCKSEIEQAYSEIVTAEDISELNADLAELAKKLGIDTADLAVSDLFDMDYKNCNHEEHRNEHGYFTIRLKAETLANFVGLLHYNVDRFELVEDAKVEGNLLVFKMKDFSPFAVVVDSSLNSPETGDNTNLYFWIILAVISALTVAFCWKKFRKASAK